MLVTGGCGFIGTHLCRRLTAAGARVRILDDLSTGRRPADQASLIESSITDRGDVLRAARDCDTVFHLAAMVSVPACEAEPERCHETNVTGTDIVVQAAARARATLVFASSCAVYGPSCRVPCCETDHPAPGTRYASSKLAGEAIILSAVARGDLEATPLRFFNVFGPGQRTDVAYAAVVSLFSEAASMGTAITLDGDGTQTRDFVPVPLAVDALCRAAVKPAGEPVNVGTGCETSLLQLIAAIEAATGGQPLERHYGPPRPGDITRSVADTDMLTRRYGLPGAYASKAAMEQTLADLLKQPGPQCS